MKRIFIAFTIMLMSISLTTQAGNKSNNTMKNIVPTNIVVKQTTQFNDGRTLIVYYKKSGSQCEVYSPQNEKDYSVNDASKIKSTQLEVVDKVEGKLYRKATITEVARLIKRLVNRLL